MGLLFSSKSKTIQNKSTVNNAFDQKRNYQDSFNTEMSFEDSHDVDDSFNTDNSHKDSFNTEMSFEDSHDVDDSFNTDNSHKDSFNTDNSIEDAFNTTNNNDFNDDHSIELDEGSNFAGGNLSIVNNSLDGETIKEAFSLTSEIARGANAQVQSSLKKVGESNALALQTSSKALSDAFASTSGGLVTSFENVIKTGVWGVALYFGIKLWKGA